MKDTKNFKYTGGKLTLPVFFPDATRGFVRSIDSVDLAKTKTEGVLVNTFHLYNQVGKQMFKKTKGIKPFMKWDDAVISDSGGFQVMSLIKSKIMKGEIIDKGIVYRFGKSRTKIFTPEESIRYQLILKTDMVIVLDDFTPQRAGYEVARQTVERTVLWAKRCKDEFDRLCQQANYTEKTRPYLLGVVQGGEDLKLRKECLMRLIEIGFDGLGYGGWPIDPEGNFNYDVAKLIAENSPKKYLVYGLGIGKPDEIVKLSTMGYDIFDCVLPTRDARHGRLYVFNSYTLDKIDVSIDNFYSYYSPDKKKYFYDDSPVSEACDCLLCTNYTRAYLAHLFREKETTALRLSTIHNLRFYSLLMEKIRNS